jgi:hypothetical protein
MGLLYFCASSGICISSGSNFMRVLHFLTHGTRRIVCKTYPVDIFEAALVLIQACRILFSETHKILVAINTKISVVV